MESYLDILMERAEIIKRWKEYVTEVAKVVKTILPDSHVYVFGSVVKGEAVGGSDVDILIVSKHLPKDGIKRAEIKVRVEELSNLPPYHPLEFHFVDEEEAEWYFKRVKELREVRTSTE